MTNEMLCIYSLIQAWAESTPTSRAITAPGRLPLTYQQLQAQIDLTGEMLSAVGIGHKDRVAVVLPDGPEAAVAFVSLASHITMAPLNPAYRAKEFEFYLSDLNVKALIVHSEIASPAVEVAQARGIPVIKLQPLLEEEAGLFLLEGEKADVAVPNHLAHSDDIALLLHTSGTTSRPKLVPLTQANLACSARHIQKALQLVQSDHCLNIMPLFHIHGLIAGVLASLASGASVICTPGFYAPAFFEWMETFRPTWYTAVPAMHQAILARSGANQEIIDRCPLRFIRSASSALPPQVMSELEHVFTVPLIEAYGMTEASHQIASNPFPPYVRKVGSVGLAAGPEVACMDEEGNFLPSGAIGELVLRGPNIIRGYEDNPTANEKAFTNGWFRTGDQGYIDDDGYIFLTGRLKEIINRGGEKIAPREVDEVLLSHPAVAQAVAFAIPHDTLGEEIAAAIVLHDGAVATERELREFAADRIAAFKVPRHIVMLDEIPRGPTGKPQRIGLARTLGISSFEEVKRKQAGPPVAPRTPLEAALTEIWSQVLGLQQIGVHDDFLDLGGDSILATQIIARIHATLHLEVSLLIMFDEPTVALQAQALTQSLTEK